MPKDFDYGLVFAEIFILENLLPVIVYHGESKLPALFAAGSQNSLGCFLPRVVTPHVLY